MSQLQSEIQFLATRLEQAIMPLELKAKAQRMLARLQTASTVETVNSQELEIVSKYIDWITQLPYTKQTQDNLDLASAKRILDSNHFGLTEVKESVLEFLSVKKLLADRGKQVANEHNGFLSKASPIMCFVGVQGIGKTTMVRSIAASLGRSFQRIPLGAFADVSEIRGRARSEMGAEPGQIIKALIKGKTMNPVILLDEIDKISESSGLKADIMAALLEILDPEQNNAFTDRYIDYPIDLSQVLFVATANNTKTLSAALLDRMEQVRFPSYTDQEKEVIGKTYLLPRVLADAGLAPEQLSIADEVWPTLIRPYGMDPGIRELERNLKQLARKVAKMIVEGFTGQIVITNQNFRQFFPDKIAIYS
jgi:ATP-dependent Lon protease